MPNCTQCGHYASRRRRNLFVKLFSRASFHCTKCGANFHFYRSFIACFQRWSRCPLCHNRDLDILQRADKVDRMSGNVLRALLRFPGCSLYHCTFCRYQFRDWRSLDPDRTSGRARSAAAK
jgi:hypothetical protein